MVDLKTKYKEKIKLINLWCEGNADARYCAPLVLDIKQKNQSTFGVKGMLMPDIVLHLS